MGEAQTKTSNNVPMLGRIAGSKLRVGFLALLTIVELPLVAFLYDPTVISTSPAWRDAHMVMREAVPFTLFFLVAMALVLTQQRSALSASWASHQKSHHWRIPLLANLVLFAALIFGTLQFNQINVGNGGAPWRVFALWCICAGAAYGALALALAPVKFWRDFIDRYRIELALGAGAATFIEAAAVMSRQSWSLLSEATFRFSAALLSLFEKNVSIIPDKRIIGVGDFKVNIAAACSGYEGVGLVFTFLLVYFWVFRKSLKFPNVLIMLPIGVASIWILNSVRIAILVSLGAHVSEDIAITGFHSQAGWMMFLLVTVGIMLATHRISFFHRAEAERSTPPPIAGETAAALLAPFLAMTAAAIITAAFSAGANYWLYGLRVTALAIAIFAFWRFYRSLSWAPVLDRAGLETIGFGLLVGAVWIATDPGRAAPSDLGVWLTGLPPALFVLWLTIRFIGTALFVPLAEELAFRGYLHRKLVAENFENVAEGAFSWKAFLISSALFGVLHDRWLAGALAGAVFAAALYRSGKLSGAIVSHGIANAVIFFWALAMAQWSLL